MKLLKKVQQESYKNAKICCICKEKHENKSLNDKNVIKLEIIVIRQQNIQVLHTAYVIYNIVWLKKYLQFLIM